MTAEIRDAEPERLRTAEMAVRAAVELMCDRIQQARGDRMAAHATSCHGR